MYLIGKYLHFDLSLHCYEEQFDKYFWEKVWKYFYNNFQRYATHATNRDCGAIKRPSGESLEVFPEVFLVRHPTLSRARSRFVP